LEDSKVKIIFLGTNGWYSSNTGNTVSILIDSQDYYIILDAGDGLHKLDNFIHEKKPIILFLSHTHLDHIIGLHILGKFPFMDELKIYGYLGIKQNLEKIIKHPYSAPFEHLPTEVEIFELDEGEHHLPFKVETGLLLHADPCLGYRFTLEDKIITYCTDTGLCDNLYTLSKDADLFITECSYKPGQENWGWPHLKPEEAAQVAKRSEVKKLFLTHFDASIYQTQEEREVAAKTSKNIFSDTTVAYDSLEITI
jgi:ribonuclease BN (tRNA processing enzyme)